MPPIEGLTDIDYLTNENVWDLDELPASLAGLGGGAVGCELAQALARLGSAVTVIEGLDRILPREDPDASAVITEALRADGVAVRTGEVVMRVAALDRKRAARLHMAAGSTVDAERLLVAVGRAEAIDGLGLDAAGVETARGFITTDTTLATTGKGVWAVGDVTGRCSSPTPPMRWAGSPPPTRWADSAGNASAATPCRGSRSPIPKSPRSASPKPTPPTDADGSRICR